MDVGRAAEEKEMNMNLESAECLWRQALDYRLEGRYQDGGEHEGRAKPCPFCGGMAEIVEIDEGENAGGSCVVAAPTCTASSESVWLQEDFI